MDIQAVQTAMQQALPPTLHSYDYGPDSVSSPAAYIYPDPFSFDADFDGSTTATFVVRILVASVNDKGGQQTLNGYVNPWNGTVVAALRADPKFGGVVQSSHVTGLREYGVVQLQDGGTRYYSAELMVEVLA